MKRIVRLTESDLTRIVRRVINEQSGSGEALYQKIKGLIGSAYIGNWWNKPAILDALDTIKDCATYLELWNICTKKRGYVDISSYIIDTLDTVGDYDKTQSANVVNPLEGLKTGLTDAEFNTEVKRKLGKWGGKCFKK